MSDPQYEKPRTEHFDVVLLKRSVSEFSATPGDFKRIAVEAADPISAQADPKVMEEEKEYRCLGAVPPGYQTEPEMMAQQRTYAGNVTDRANIGLPDPRDK